MKTNGNPKPVLQFVLGLTHSETILNIYAITIQTSFMNFERLSVEV